MSAKQCQNVSEPPVAAASDASLNGPFQFMPLAWQHADICEVFGFASAVTGQVAVAKQFGANGVAHLGDLLAETNFERPKPQFIMPARQYGIEGGPFWQITQLQNSQRKFLHT